jgi:hypothetical protein
MGEYLAAVFYAAAQNIDSISRKKPGSSALSSGPLPIERSTRDSYGKDRSCSEKRKHA